MIEWDLDEAIRMWNSGKTAKAIAQHFHVTKNVVTGPIHRARYKGVDVNKKANPSKARPKPKRVVPTPAAKAGVQLKLIKGEAPVREGFRIYELEQGQCKYAVAESEAGEHLFCGASTSTVYCDMHHKLCHTQPEPKKKSTFVFDPKRKFLRYR